MLQQSYEYDFWFLKLHYKAGIIPIFLDKPIEVQ